ncbi:hypothetical protein LCGC14_0231300 [marine sediment metagenome]|uniref:Uncharacterized protein n=1 Tax=marine sediment metagenome TaxID=412755 RepID=A0A0F9XE25_9ZZZZ
MNDPINQLLATRQCGACGAKGRVLNKFDVCADCVAKAKPAKLPRDIKKTTKKKPVKKVSSKGKSPGSRPGPPGLTVMDIGKIIRRLEAGLSQRKVAVKTGFNLSTVQKYRRIWLEQKRVKTHE